MIVLLQEGNCLHSCNVYSLGNRGIDFLMKWSPKLVFQEPKVLLVQRLLCIVLQDSGGNHMRAYNQVGLKVALVTVMFVSWVLKKSGKRLGKFKANKSFNIKTPLSINLPVYRAEQNLFQRLKVIKGAKKNNPKTTFSLSFLFFYVLYSTSICTTKFKPEHNVPNRLFGVDVQ